MSGPEPANVAPLEQAPLGVRALALLIDVVPAYGPPVAAAVAAVAWFDRAAPGQETDLEPAAGTAVLVAAFWSVVYFGLRRTLGKRAFGLHVAGRGLRSRVRGLWSLLPWTAVVWPLTAPLLAADVIWPFFDHRRALHDRLAATEVLRPVPESHEIRSLRAAGSAGRRAYAQAALEWAAARPADEGELAAARDFAAAAAHDPYAATAAWGHVTSAVTMPLLAREDDEEIDEEAFEDPALQELYEEADRARLRALEELRARLAPASSGNRRRSAGVSPPA